MARGATRDLYLQVRGDISSLRQATQAGKTVLNDFGGAAINVIEEVEKELAKVGANGLPNLSKIEKSYTDTFRRMQDAARAVIDAPTPQAAVAIIDSNAAQQAAASATAQAQALRLVAEAAQRADQATGGTDAATRAYAVSAATAAVNAENEAQALRDQAIVLARVDQQLGVNAGSQRKAVAVTGEARAGYQQLSYQLGDVATQYAAGTSASIIFAQQSGQVIQAISLIAGEADGFAKFLRGPWLIAAGAAATVLTPWVAKLIEGGDALEKETRELEENAEKSAIADRAKAAFARSEAGLIEDVRKLTEEIDKQNESLKTNAERLNIRAQKDLRGLGKERGDVLGELAAARQALRLARGSVASGGGSADDAIAAERAVTAAKTKVAAIEARLKTIDVAIAEATAARLETQKDLAAEDAKRSTDEIAQINRRYDSAEGLIEQAKRQATAEEVVNGTLTRRLILLEKQRAAALKTARERQSAASGTGNQQFGREIDVAGATAIVASIGGRVTSGIRSTERQAELYAAAQAGRHNGPVARPGTSAHEAGGPYDAIDVAYGPGISVKSIREAFAKEGVKLRKILNEPGQRVFHVEFATGQRSADAQKRSDQAEANRQTQNADAYASLDARARADAVQFMRSRATSIEELANLEVASVEAKRDELVREAEKGFELGKWSESQSEAVALSASITAGLKIESIRQDEKLAIANRAFEIEQADLDDKVSLLRLQGDLADTADERRAIARQLLRIEQDQVEEELKNRIANARDPKVKAQLERRLAQVAREYELKGQKLEEDHADPLQAYGKRLIRETADLDTELKRVAADGFGALEDASSRAAASAIADFLKLKGVAGDVIGGIIADLARLAIKKAIVGAFGKSFFGLADGGEVIQRAGGGPVFGPGGPRDDVIPALLSNGEFVINAASTARYRPLIEAINDGRLPRFADGGLVAPTSWVPRLPSIAAAQAALRPAGGATIVHHHHWTVNAQGSVLASDLLQEMRTMSQAAVIGGARLAEQNQAERLSMVLE